MSATSLRLFAADVETRCAVRVETAVYKKVEEALTSVMRQASARSARISL